MALVRSERPTIKYVKKWPLKQNIVVFLYSSTMTMAPCLHLNIKTKEGITYSIESDNFFFRDHYVFGTKKS